MVANEKCTNLHTSPHPSRMNDVETDMWLSFCARGVVASSYLQLHLLCLYSLKPLQAQFQRDWSMDLLEVFGCFWPCHKTWPISSMAYRYLSISGRCSIAAMFKGKYLLTEDQPITIVFAALTRLALIFYRHSLRVWGQFYEKLWILRDPSK